MLRNLIIRLGKYFACSYFSMWKIFRVLKFRRQRHQQNIFNNENFPICGTYMHINIVFLLAMMKEVPFPTSPRVDPTMCPLICVQWGTCKLTDGLCILKGIVSKPQRSLFGSLTHVQDITNYLFAHPQANKQILQTFYTSLVWSGIKRSRLSTAPCTSVYS